MERGSKVLGLVCCVALAIGVARGGETKEVRVMTIDRAIQCALQNVLEKYADTNDTGRAWGGGDGGEDGCDSGDGRHMFGF